MKGLTKTSFFLIFISIISFSCKNDDGPVVSMQETEMPDEIYAFEHGGKSYEIVKEKRTWKLAAAYAVERGGYLAEVNSSGENNAIFGAATLRASLNLERTKASDGGNASYIWIGGNDITVEGKWVWDGNDDSTSIQFWEGGVSGEAIDGLYNNWGNEPDNFDGSQNGLGLALTEWPEGSGALGSANQWNDINEGNGLYFVIEYD